MNVHLKGPKFKNWWFSIFFLNSSSSKYSPSIPLVKLYKKDIHRRRNKIVKIFRFGHQLLIHFYSCFGPVAVNLFWLVIWNLLSCRALAWEDQYVVHNMSYIFKLPKWDLLVVKYNIGQVIDKLNLRMLINSFLSQDIYRRVDLKMLVHI